MYVEATYHGAFDGFATQEHVFDDNMYLVQFAFDGYNVCIFAYRQSGFGKTHIIYESRSNLGLSTRAISEVFKIMTRESNKFSSFFLRHIHRRVIPRYACKSFVSCQSKQSV
ncbi:hypothetical protein ACH5RR_021967 [Cinchona calisaya]|uniref:Kinesin motor domain-containing protein n=1 Tax=Cinchona calisaya TaxID=153742 RepID=A0ABD2Z9R9_9GENT